LVFATRANLDSDHDSFPAGAHCGRPGEKGFTRRRSPLGLRPPSAQRRRLPSYTTPGDANELVGYCEYAYEIVGSDSWMNHRYFEKRKMRPLFVEEIAVHPQYHGMGIGTFMFEQIEHAARLRGCTHIVLEVAENNEEALRFYRKRRFKKLDAAVFLSRRLGGQDDLLPPRRLRSRK
jgi:ribosomal protein S18 acetylase RimI-like enzyme